MNQSKNLCFLPSGYSRKAAEKQAQKTDTKLFSSKPAPFCADDKRFYCYFTR
jgi:hypothetical protein